MKARLADLFDTDIAIIKAIETWAAMDVHLNTLTNKDADRVIGTGHLIKRRLKRARLATVQPNGAPANGAAATTATEDKNGLIGSGWQ
jgi:hypothetical protein